ncbi:hypothetical protein AB0P37_39405 [Streptomyces antimycoticus]|uniref:hypothetical protein n=1 Tax=Streptomyces antimycoticus TaxID=68175 RepID=UPI003448BFE9
MSTDIANEPSLPEPSSNPESYADDVGADRERSPESDVDEFLYQEELEDYQHDKSNESGEGSEHDLFPSQRKGIDEESMGEPDYDSTTGSPRETSSQDASAISESSPDGERGDFSNPLGGSAYSDNGTAIKTEKSEHEMMYHATDSSSVTGDYELRPAGPAHDQGQHSPESTIGDTSQSTVNHEKAAEAKTDLLMHNQSTPVVYDDTSVDTSKLPSTRGLTGDELIQFTRELTANELIQVVRERLKSAPHDIWYEGKGLSPEVEDAARIHLPDTEELQRRSSLASERLERFPEEEQKQRDEEEEKQAIAKGPEAYKEWHIKHGYFYVDDVLHEHVGSVRVVENDTKMTEQEGARSALKARAVAEGLHMVHGDARSVEVYGHRERSIKTLEVDRPTEDRLRQVYDAASALSPIYAKAAHKMLTDLRGDIAGGCQKIIFTGRDAKPISVAIRQIDPHFHQQYCIEIPFSRRSLQSAARDPELLESMDPEELANRDRVLERNFRIPEDVAGGRGEYRALTEMFKKAGVDLDSEAPVIIVDNGTKGTLSGTLECILPRMRTHSRFMVASHLPNDYLGDRKEGYLGNINIPRNEKELDKPYDSRFAESAKTVCEVFEARGPLLFLEEIFQGHESTMLRAASGDRPDAIRALTEGDGMVYRVVARQALEDSAKFWAHQSEAQRDEDWENARQLLFLAHLPPDEAVQRLESRSDKEVLAEVISNLRTIRDTPLVDAKPWDYYFPK